MAGEEAGHTVSIQIQQRYLERSEGLAAGKRLLRKVRLLRMQDLGLLRRRGTLPSERRGEIQEQQWRIRRTILRVPQPTHWRHSKGGASWLFLARLRLEESGARVRVLQFGPGKERAVRHC